MDIAEVHAQLCYHDRRNPLWESLHYGEEPGEVQPPRQDCYCDNCFYGRDKLALEIIRLNELTTKQHQP